MSDPRSNATGQGFRDANAYMLALANYPFRDNVAPDIWKAIVSEAEAARNARCGHMLYVAAEFPDNVITSGIPAGSPPVDPPPNWPVGTGEPSGLFSRYAWSALKLTTALTTAWNEMPVPVGDWPAADATAGLHNFQQRYIIALLVVAPLIARARRVGPPWEQPLA